jgi:hypothetical protein
MNSENRGDKSAAPDTASPARTAGHFPEQEKEQENGNGVEQHVREMMSARVQSKNLTIKHVRHRSERGPVTDVMMRERPGYAVKREATDYFRPIEDVSVIVIVHEVVVERLAENNPSDGYK